MRKIVTNPENYPSRSLVKQCVKMKNIFKDGFYFIEEKQSYKAIYIGKKTKPVLSEGGYISIRGTVKNEILFFSDYHLHRYRHLKIIVSVITLGGVCIYLGSFFYLSRREQSSMKRKDYA